MLEEKITELTSKIDELIDALKSNVVDNEPPASKPTKTAGKTKAKSKPAPAPEPELVSEPEEKTYSQDELREILISVTERINRDTAKSLLKTHSGGCEMLGLVPKENYAAVYQACEAALNEASQKEAA